MKSFVRNRFSVVVLGVPTLLVVLVLGRYLSKPQVHKVLSLPQTSNQPPRTVIIGDFTVPPLMGWHQRILSYKDLPNVTFEKREKEGKLEITIGDFENRRFDAPRNMSGLQSEVQSYLVRRTKTLGIISTKVQFGKSRPTLLNGMTAVETPVTTQDRFTTMTGKYLHFIHNGRYYMINYGINVPNGKLLSPQLQYELDQAVNTIGKFLMPQVASKSSKQPTVTTAP